MQINCPQLIFPKINPLFRLLHKYNKNILWGQTFCEQQPSECLIEFGIANLNADLEEVEEAGGS